MFALIYTCKTHTITSFSEKLYGYYLSGIHALAFDFALFFSSQWSKFYLHFAIAYYERNQHTNEIWTEFR